MFQTLNTTLAGAPLFGGTLNRVQKNLARSMVGATVDLLTDHKTIVHGMVAGVFMTAGTPKIVVNGHGYDIDQVLTAVTAPNP